MHYRELVVWRKAIDLAKQVYRLAAFLPKEETYGIRAQITRAAVSIAANIAEGWSRESEKERAQFLAIAQGSLAETETLLTLCEEMAWIPPGESAMLRSLIDETGKILSTFRRKLREQGLGPKS